MANIFVEMEHWRIIIERMEKVIDNVLVIGIRAEI